MHIPDDNPDDSLRSLMHDTGESNSLPTAIAAREAWSTFAHRKARRNKILGRAVPVCAITLIASVALFLHYANRSHNAAQDQLTTATNTNDSSAEEQLADLQRKIDQLQAEVDEQKRLLEQYRQSAPALVEVALDTTVNETERIARLNRELDRRFETERAASTFLNFARRYAAENKKDLAIVEYNRVLRSFSESDTAKIAREELSQLTTM